MKKNITYLFLMMALTLSSCKDFLESESTDFLDPDNYYTNLGTLDAGLMGIYTVMVSPDMYAEGTLCMVLTTSDLEFYNGASLSYRAMYFNFTSADSYVRGYWDALYQGISRANAFIDRIENSQLFGVNDEYRDAAVGEAYALRAFYYWHLAANFGGVPLRTTFENEINPHRERAPLAKVYEQIVSDLKKAEGMVYEVDHFDHQGRITQTTVQALLARAYLYMAGNPLNDTEKYAEALKWARKVRDSGLHSLNPSYENFFTRLILEEYDLDYRESMWEVEFHGTQGIDQLWTQGQWGNFNGISCGDDNIGYANARLTVTRLLENWYMENTNDKRYPWSVATYRWNGTPAAKQNRSIEQRYPGKYRRDVHPGPKAKNFTGTNVPLMRYADVLLMLAEAANEVGGPTDEAIEALNEVRRRAGIRECANNLDDMSKVILTTKEDFREFIKKERALELCFECTRRLDLVRWGDLVENVKYMSSIATQAYAKRVGNFIAEKHNLLPIPASEMNSNSLIRQNNPGW